jgi:hypothetical protein
VKFCCLISRNLLDKHTNQMARETASPQAALTSSALLSFMRGLVYKNMAVTSTLSLSPKCLADGIPFIGFRGWIWWLRGVRRSSSNPNLCNR